MRVVIVIFIFFVQSLGVVQPGIYSPSLDLHKMYVQCSEEDPDITPADFVFEHLLNLEDAMEYFENDEEHEEGERPHQPLQITHNASLLVTAFPKTIELDLPQYLEVVNETSYPANRGNIYYYNFNKDIFRPPII